MTPFTNSSFEALPIGDRQARARSALRLGDLQASGSQPRAAQHDGGGVRTMAAWDLYFAEEAFRRLPRTAGLVNFHVGWPGMATLRLSQAFEHREFWCRGPYGEQMPDAERDAGQVQAAITEYAAALDPQWTIVLTRVLNQVPDPGGLIEALLPTRARGGGVVLTAMGAPSPPFVFNAGIRLGIPDWDMVRGWAEKHRPVLSAVASTTMTEQWPRHILFGMAFST